MLYIANQKLTALKICKGNSDNFVETSFKSETDPSGMSILKETKETVKIVESVLVKTTEVSLEDGNGVTTIMDNRT